MKLSVRLEEFVVLFSPTLKSFPLFETEELSLYFLPLPPLEELPPLPPRFAKEFWSFGMLFNEADSLAWFAKASSTDCWLDKFVFKKPLIATTNEEIFSTAVAILSTQLIATPLLFKDANFDLKLPELKLNEEIDESKQLQAELNESTSISVVIEDNYISDLKKYAEDLLNISNDIIVHDLIYKEGTYFDKEEYVEEGVGE